jgi:hypothetical protein
MMLECMIPGDPFIFCLEKIGSIGGSIDDDDDDDDGAGGPLRMPENVEDSIAGERIAVVWLRKLVGAICGAAAAAAAAAAAGPTVELENNRIGAVCANGTGSTNEDPFWFEDKPGTTIVGNTLLLCGA